MDPRTKVDGEVLLSLVDAWRELEGALLVASGDVFSRSAGRREFVRRVRSLRGCVLLAAGRLIDLGNIEGGAGAEFEGQRVAGLASLLATAEGELLEFFGVAPPRGKAAEARAAGRRKTAQRAEVVRGLREHDAMLQEVGQRAERRAASEAAEVQRVRDERVRASAAEMRRRAGVDE